MIDIIVPVCNNLHQTTTWLNCVLSNLTSDFKKEVKVYLVDSSDKDEIYNEFCTLGGFSGLALDSRIIYIPHTFTSLAGLWNEGIKKSDADLILIMDVGCFLTRLENLVYHLEMNKEVKFITPLENQYLNHSKINTFQDRSVFNKNTYPEHIDKHFEDYNGWIVKFLPNEYIHWERWKRPTTNTEQTKLPPTSSCMLFYRSLYKQIGPFDEQFVIGYESLDFLIRANLNHFVGVAADTIVYNDQPQLNWSPPLNWAADSSSRRKDKTKFLAKWKNRCTTSGLSIGEIWDV